jgi:hypothetical protein
MQTYQEKTHPANTKWQPRPIRALRSIPRDADPDLCDRLIPLAVERASIEREIVAIVLASPVEGIALAEKYGVTVDLISLADLRIIFDAARLAGHLGIEAVAILARRGLQHFGYWNECAAIGTLGEQWSDLNLSFYATEWFYSPLQLAARCRQLVKLDIRQTEITDLLGRVDRLIDGTEFPTPAIHGRPRPRLVILPRKKGVA